MRVCMMPTHRNEEGMESTTELLKFKGKACLFKNSLIKMEAGSYVQI